MHLANLYCKHTSKLIYYPILLSGLKNKFNILVVHSNLYPMTITRDILIDAVPVWELSNEST